MSDSSAQQGADPAADERALTQPEDEGKEVPSESAETLTTRPVGMTDDPHADTLPARRTMRTTTRHRSSESVEETVEETIVEDLVPPLYQVPGSPYPPTVG